MAPMVTKVANVPIVTMVVIVPMAAMVTEVTSVPVFTVVMTHMFVKIYQCSYC
jgi:hypothetical protein